MGDFVKSKVVSMEWEKKGFLKEDGVFKVAGKEYQNADGQTIPVYFTSSEAFFWADNGASTFADLWQFADLIPWAHENFDGSFPNSYGEFVPVVDANGVANKELLARFGIEEFASDIEARMDDISKFGKWLTDEEVMKRMDGNN